MVHKLEGAQKYVAQSCFHIAEVEISLEKDCDSRFFKLSLLSIITAPLGPIEPSSSSILSANYVGIERYIFQINKMKLLSELYTRTADLIFYIQLSQQIFKKINLR